jgi:spore coat polysaccharide biosynthesis protein SpsF (cytidylyltransferase family)
MNVAIIQVRMRSTRLPGKVLLPLSGKKAALECMLERVQRSKLLGKVVVAASDAPEDAELHALLGKIGQPYAVGSEDDVLDRYYRCAERFCVPGDVIVRLTSDCPVIDPRVIDEAIRFYLGGRYDYASNSLEPYSWPDGMDVEVFSYRLLERAAREAVLPSEREHVTFYFWKHPERFKVGYLRNKKNLSSYRLTLDHPGDYALLKNVYGHFSPRVDFSMEEILKYLDAHPDVKKLNSAAARNAGWQSALKKDSIAK